MSKPKEEKDEPRDSDRARVLDKPFGNLEEIIRERREELA